MTHSHAVRMLQFATLFASGGTERQVMNLARGLDPSRFDVRLACLKRWGDFLEEIDRSGRPLTEYPVNRAYTVPALRQQLRLAADLRRQRIDVVHTYGFKVNVFGIPAARMAGTPVVVAGIRDTCDQLTSVQRRVQRVVCGMADGVVVNAAAIKERLVADGYDPARVTVITNGIEMARFDGVAPDGRVRSELGLPQDAPLVAVFARLNPVKGIEDFLQAAAALGERFPSARFLVVGQGCIVQDGVIVETPYKRELEACATRLGLAGRVVFTGFRLDIPELLSEVAVSVLPCVANEGLSNSVLESMAAGVPVVATTVGGNPEAIEDGVSGLLVPPRDPASLARAIGALLEDPQRARALGAAARRRVTERFSDTHMVRQTERFYLSLLEARREGARWWHRDAARVGAA
jgi:glycosyltransferase involved in cell wall biosynthesis